MAQQYKIRGSGEKYRGVHANAIGFELERIRERDGQLEPKAIVRSAKPEKSPLHPVFTWDDAKAADEFRNWEARHLIRSVIVINPETKEESPAYFNIRVTNDGGSQRHYQSGDVLVGRPDEFESAYQILMEKMRSAAKALDDLKRLAQESPEDADRLALLIAVADSLSTARTIAERLQ